MALHILGVLVIYSGDEDTSSCIFFFKKKEKQGIHI